MCLTIPAKIVTLNKGTATVQQGTENREIDITLLDSVRVGDYILEQAGFAFKKISSQEAKQILNTLKL